MCKLQTSVVDPDWIRIGSGFNGFPGLGYRRAKMTQKNIKCWMFSLRAEGFSYSLDFFYEGLGISKLQLLIKKDI